MIGKGIIQQQSNHNVEVLHESNNDDILELKDCIPEGLEPSMEANDLNQACDQIHLEKSSQDENEIERNLDNYDCKQYKGIDKERERVMYNTKKIDILGIKKQKSKEQKVDDLDDSEKFAPMVIKRKEDFKKWAKEGEELY